jgi:hypothetical protein
MAVSIRLHGEPNVLVRCSIAPLATCFHAGLLLGLFFDSEDGGDMLLRNVGSL